jgi:hypothetical protein
MKSNSVPEEVAVLRFFETGPIERVEPVFNIVTAKMSERLQGSTPVASPALTGRKRQRAQSTSLETGSTHELAESQKHD